MFTTIVVGTDGSETAQRAVTKAAELATQFGATLHIVCAYQRKPIPLDPMLPTEFAWSLTDSTGADRTLANASRSASDRGANVEIHAVAGPAATAIVATAHDVGADLIVVGSKGIERRILGSVPNGVTHAAGCSVLVIHTT
ncbi:MAG: universal stress protein [Acidimicrobiales bacterium]